MPTSSVSGTNWLSGSVVGGVPAVAVLGLAEVGRLGGCDAVSVCAAFAVAAAIAVAAATLVLALGACCRPTQ